MTIGSLQYYQILDKHTAFLMKDTTKTKHMTGFDGQSHC
jgi:hypothetical protein